MNIYRLFELPVYRVLDYIDLETGKTRLTLSGYGKYVVKKVERERISRIEVSGIQPAWGHVCITFVSDLGYSISVLYRKSVSRITNIRYDSEHQREYFTNARLSINDILKRIRDDS